MATLTIPGQFQALGQQYANMPQQYEQLGWSATTTTANTLGWDMATSLTTTGDVHCGGIVYANGFQDWAQKAYQKMVTFFRVNQPVTIPEGGTIEEPLDELRIKVMRWLDGVKVTA